MLKDKKLGLSAIVLAAAIVAMAIFSIVSSIALKPTITELLGPAVFAVYLIGCFMAELL